MQKLLPILMVLVTPFLLNGQVMPAQNDSLKIGLVLSGGGAKGLAHIGVLKILDESGIKVDYIGGTSMGAIVGALYAAGYSAIELEEIFTSTDLSELVQDQLPRDAKTFYEKEDSERYALTLPFDGYKISFPEAISGGQNIYNHLVKQLYHVKDITDFSKLPIPFFCVATDVETGEEIILNSGYLPEAIMASGTFPTFFEPTEIDGRILIDGGVVNNYPVEKMLALGANFIIGIDVQSSLVKRESLNSGTEIILQISNYASVNDMEEKRKKTNIYIKPNIEEFSVFDFDLGSRIIESGQIAAMTKIEEIRRLASITSNKPKISLQIKEPDSINVNRLILSGNDNYSRGYIKGKLRFNLAEKTTFDKLQHGISNLSATNNFKTIRYDLATNGVGVDLNLKLKENPNKTFIRLGVHYDDLFKSAALVNLTKKNFLMADDVASFDFILGDHLRYNMEYYVDKGSYWSFGINSRFVGFDQEVGYDLLQSNFDAPLGNNISVINLDVTDLTNQFYLQTVWKEEFAFTIGAEHKFLKYSTRTIGNVLEESNIILANTQRGRTVYEKSHLYSSYGKLTLDTYDDKYFPSKGLYFNGDFHFYMFSSDFAENFKEFSIGKARLGVAFPIANNLSFNIETEGGLKFGNSSVKSMDFVLGGFGNYSINNLVSFLGYDFLSLHGNSFVKAFSRLDYEIAPKNHLMLMANFANVDDDLFRLGDWFREPTYSGYGLGYGWESFFGPVQIIYSKSPQLKEPNIFISIGYWF